MSADTSHKHEQWSSEFLFILAALGSAVGLGNIWRFPYIAGENGGGAFVILYLGFIVVLGLPALIATIMIGRRGQSSPISCFEKIARAENHSLKWAYVGWLLVISAYLLLTFFSVVASWTFDYMIKAVSGAFADLEAASSGALFSELLSSPVRLALWHGLFMGLTLFVVGKGIRKGIEKAIKFMIPSLFFLLLILLVYSLVIGDGAGAFRFLFQPDFSRLDANVIMIAMGQAFLTLSVGGAGMLVYGAYLQKTASIPRAAVAITITDTLVALLTGLVIFPIVFAYGLQAGEGPGLIFVTLPIALGQMPGGIFFSILFFILLLLATLSSAFSMFEPVVAWLDERAGIPRKKAALLAGVVAWFIGLATVFSFNLWSQVRPLGFIPLFADMDIFRTLEYIVTNVFLPAGSLLVAIFVGWILLESTRKEEFGERNRWYPLWRILIRYVVPLSVSLIFIVNL